MQAAADQLKPAEREDVWPALPLEEWQDTYATLHMWTQVAGKVRLALSPHVNHWWEVPLYVSARGLSTSPIPYGHRVFEIEFDLLDHNVAIRASDGHTKFVPLYSRSVAEFYPKFMATLRSLRIDVKIWSTLVEVPDPIPLEQDKKHAAYNPEYTNRFWRILVQTDSIFKIADLAGVGVGTLYRHFPRRSDLSKAVFQREVDACADAAPALAAAHPLGVAVEQWLPRYTAFLATKRGLATALHSGDPAFDALPGYFMQRLGPALGSLLDAATARGEMRADISPQDLLHAVATLCLPAAGEGVAYSQRMVTLLIDGLRYGAAASQSRP